MEKGTKLWVSVVRSRKGKCDGVVGAKSVSRACGSAEREGAAFRYSLTRAFARPFVRERVRVVIPS